jgi:carbon-monoxide dehydrogenase large subunit
VSIVIAESAAVAADAAELVVDYDPLPAVVDAVEAAAEQAPLLFPATGTNVAVNIPFEAGHEPEGGTVSVR